MIFGRDCMGFDRRGVPLRRESLLRFKRFMENLPPGGYSTISDLLVGTEDGPVLQPPALRLFCGTEMCDGLQRFECGDEAPRVGEAPLYLHLRYRCTQCRLTEKVYSLAVRRTGKGPGGALRKIGEYPPFGSGASATLLAFFGADNAHIDKALACEQAGFGAAAVDYYRRAFEAQWPQVLHQMMSVGGWLGLSQTHRDVLQQAAAQPGVRQSIAQARGALDAHLGRDGLNPLDLLSALLYAPDIDRKPDADLLADAASIRVLLEGLGGTLRRVPKAPVRHAPIFDSAPAH